MIDEREYWEKREREMNAEMAAGESRLERRNRLMKMVVNADTGMMAVPAYAAKIEAARAELAQMDAEVEAAFWAEWTPEVTAQRRAEWNAWVKAHRNPGWPEIRRQEKSQGWTLESLKKAVAGK